MRAIRHPLAALALVFAAVLGFGIPRPAQAGCGCDHPPPPWSIVMPPFGSPGKGISIFAEGGEFVPGATYEVDFGGRRTTTVAQATSYIEVAVPHDVTPGPVALAVGGDGYSHVYPEAAFTALPPEHVIPFHQQVLLKKNWRSAVSADGTLLIPVDLTQVLEATQFALSIRNLALAFGHDDVVIYNADGVDLTLFTLDVTDSTQRFWGSYYGWNVEEDTGLNGVVYDKKVRKSFKKDIQSDIFTYWRHEFYTYQNAHMDSGSHEVDANGFHPDGSRHIDHFHVVLAIHGKVRNRNYPDDLSLATPLQPGHLDLNVALASFHSAGPIEPDQVGQSVEAELATQPQ